MRADYNPCFIWGTPSRCMVRLTEIDVVNRANVLVERKAVEQWLAKYDQDPQPLFAEYGQPEAWKTRDTYAGKRLEGGRYIVDPARICAKLYGFNIGFDPLDGKEVLTAVCEATGPFAEQLMWELQDPQSKAFFGLQSLAMLNTWYMNDPRRPMTLAKIVGFHFLTAASVVAIPPGFPT